MPSGARPRSRSSRSKGRRRKSFQAASERPSCRRSSSSLRFARLVSETSTLTKRRPTMAAFQAAGGRGPLELSMAPTSTPAENLLHHLAGHQRSEEQRRPTLRVWVWVWRKLPSSFRLETRPETGFRASDPRGGFCPPAGPSGGRSLRTAGQKPNIRSHVYPAPRHHSSIVLTACSDHVVGMVVNRAVSLTAGQIPLRVRETKRASGRRHREAGRRRVPDRAGRAWSGWRRRRGRS